jgi:hypothetical protein
MTGLAENVAIRAMNAFEETGSTRLPTETYDA